MSAAGRRFSKKGTGMAATAHARPTYFPEPGVKRPVRTRIEEPASLFRANLSPEDQARFELGYKLARAALEARP